MNSSPAHAKGFTLLEVMVALTITGLALGGLFGVIAGSKRLAWRAEDALVHSSQVRSLINFSQLNNEQGEVFISFENDDLNLITGSKLDMPARQTMATNEELRGYEITDESGEVVAAGTYWMFPEFPEMPPPSQSIDTNLPLDSAPFGTTMPIPLGGREAGSTAELGIRGFGPPPQLPRNDPVQGADAGFPPPTVPDQ